MNQAQEFHNAQLDAQREIAEQAKGQRDETNKLLLKAVQTLQEQLSHMKQAGSQVGGFAAGGFVHRFSEGGRVPGVGNTDSVKAYLTPGEFVIAKDVANRYYPELERLNKGGRVSGTSRNAFTPKSKNWAFENDFVSSVGNSQNTGDGSRVQRIKETDRKPPLQVGDVLSRLRLDTLTTTHIADRHFEAPDKNPRVVHQSLVARVEESNGYGNGETEKTRYFQSGRYALQDRNVGNIHSSEFTVLHNQTHGQKRVGGGNLGQLNENVS